MDLLLRPCSLHVALRQLGEQDDKGMVRWFQPSACIWCLHAGFSHWGTGGSVGSAKGRWRIRFIRNLLLGGVYLANDDLGEHADHQTFLSLPSWEIVLGLHDTAQTAQTRSGSVGREGPGTVAQGHRRAKGKAWEDLSSARARKARDHSDNEALPRARLCARRRGRRVPFAHRRDSPRPGSWHVLPEMQHTVRFVLGL